MSLRTTAMICLVWVSTSIAADKIAATVPVSADWPHWAGPMSNCTTDETGLLKEWPAEGPDVIWRIPVG